MTERSLLDDAEHVLDEAVEIRRRVHRRPEVGLVLPETQRVVGEALEALGLSVQEGRSTTSAVAVIEGAHDGPTVLLRADMDALPLDERADVPFRSEIDGVMHACGHDAHVAMLLGAARLLVDRRDQLHGRVLLMFQPGEELEGGARVMLEEGLLESVSPAPTAAFALHVTPIIRPGLVGTKPGPMMAATNEFSIVVHGEGGHAAMPHTALDPVPVACEIVTAMQTWISRRVDAFDPAVVTVGRIEAGTKDNVIPPSALMVGTIRTVSERTRTAVVEGLHQLATGIAAAHGARAEVSLRTGYPVTVNDESMAELARTVTGSVLGDGAFQAMRQPVMGAEDFSYVLQQVPGCMLFVGARPLDTERAAPSHSDLFRLEERAMVEGIALHAALALEVCRA